MRFLIYLALLVAAVPATAADEPKPPHQLRLLVPAYFYPAGRGLEEWQRLARAARDVSIVAIANPASGPGERADPNYTAAIKLAQDAGVTVIGYVTTSYGKRPQKDVQAEVDRWFQHYPSVNGIFFDEQPSGKESVAYCTALAKAVHERRKNEGALVMSNPGTTCAAEYVTPWSGINLCCLQENRFGLERYQPPDWTRTVPPAQMVGLVHSEPSISRMRANVQEALRKRVGYLYVTDGNGNNPWDRLPGYWELEVAELLRTNGKPVGRAFFSDIPLNHWAYDALQQLIQRGIYPEGYEDGVSFKRFLTGIQFAHFVRGTLPIIEAYTHVELKAWKYAVQDIRALKRLTHEFREELRHFGVTPERVSTLLNALPQRVKLPALR